MSALYLCGAGNPEGVRLALAVNAARDRWERIVLLDDDAAKHGREILGVPVEGPFERLAQASPEDDEVVNLVARTTRGRRIARQRIAAFGIPFASLVSPQVDTFGAELAGGVLVYHNATIGPEVQLGADTVVFMGAIAGHESRVGPGSVLAANSVLSARVVLGEGVYVGTNATVLPEIEVGSGATIGAGAVVVADVPPDVTVVAPPACIVSLPAVESPPPPSVAPGSPELEQTLLGIWHELLDVREISALDNFFDVGGSSLLALRVHERIERDLGITLSVTDLFRFPSVRALAGHLATREPGPSAAGAVGIARAALRRQARRGA